MVEICYCRPNLNARLMVALNSLPGEQREEILKLAAPPYSALSPPSTNSTKPFTPKVNPTSEPSAPPRIRSTHSPNPRLRVTVSSNSAKNKACPRHAVALV